METSGKSATLPPPATLPPMSRPGTRVVESPRQIKTPGVYNRDDLLPKVADEKPKAEAETPAVDTLIRPDDSPEDVKQKQFESRETDYQKPPESPACGGRVPRIGDRALFWMMHAGRLTPFPSTLIWFNEREKRWAMNIQQVGRVQGRHDIFYSDIPRNCCWTWPEVLCPGESTADVPATDLASLEARIALQGQQLDTLGEEIAELRKGLEIAMQLSGDITTELGRLRHETKPKGRGKKEKEVVADEGKEAESEVVESPVVE